MNDPLYVIDDPNVEDAHRLGTELMMRSRNTLGTIHKGGTEDRRFRQFFGISATSAVDTWGRMKENELIPDGGKFLHLLWALMFFKTYSVDTVLCSHAGGIYGAIDPKTFRKWLWPMVYAISELEYSVVSHNYVQLIFI